MAHVEYLLVAANTEKFVARFSRLMVGVIGLTIIGYWVYDEFLVRGPVFEHYDPEFQYFLNSLSIFKGHAYSYIDHPGTPIEILGSILIASTYPFLVSRQESFFQFHVSHPEVFLSLARGFLLFLNLVGFAVLVRHAFRLDRRVAAPASVGIAGLYFAIHPAAPAYLNIWSHNSFNFAFGTLLLLSLLVLAKRDHLPARYVLLLSALAGALTAVQLYFATWVIGVAVFAGIYHQIHGDTARGVFAVVNTGLGALVGFILVTIPISGRYPQLLDWIGRLISHQGRYGTGPRGFTSISAFSNNLSQLWMQAPMVLLTTAVLAITLGLLLRQRSSRMSEKQGSLALAAAIITQLLITVLLIGKHPSPIYMLSLAAITPIGLAVGLEIAADPRQLGDRRLATISWVISVAVVIGLLSNFTRAAADYRAFASGLEAQEREIERYIAASNLNNNTGDDTATILWTYGTYSLCYALSFGNEYAQNTLSSEVALACPNQTQLNIWGQVVLTPRGWVPVRSFEWDLIFTKAQLLASYGFLAELGEPTELPVSVPGFKSRYGNLQVIKPPSSR